MTRSAKAGAFAPAANVWANVSERYEKHAAPYREIHSAFGTDRFGSIAYGLALRVVRDRTLAEDAVQEAFLAVWRGAERFTAERAKPSTWVLTLVHRRAVDLVRREERRRGEPLHETHGETADEAEHVARRESVASPAVARH